MHESLYKISQALTERSACCRWRAAAADAAPSLLSAGALALRPVAEGILPSALLGQLLARVQLSLQLAFNELPGARKFLLHAQPFVLMVHGCDLPAGWDGFGSAVCLASTLRIMLHGLHRLHSLHATWIGGLELDSIAWPSGLSLLKLHCDPRKGDRMELGALRACTALLKLDISLENAEPSAGTRLFQALQGLPKLSLLRVSHLSACFHETGHHLLAHISVDTCRLHFSTACCTRGLCISALPRCSSLRLDFSSVEHPRAKVIVDWQALAAQAGLIVLLPPIHTRMESVQVINYPGSLPAGCKWALIALCESSMIAGLPVASVLHSTGWPEPFCFWRSEGVTDGEIASMNLVT